MLIVLRALLCFVFHAHSLIRDLADLGYDLDGIAVAAVVALAFKVALLLQQPVIPNVPRLSCRGHDTLRGKEKRKKRHHLR